MRRVRAGGVGVLTAGDESATYTLARDMRGGDWDILAALAIGRACDTGGGRVKLHRLVSVQRLPVPLDEAWAFFSDPANLAVMTPPWLGLVPTSKVPAKAHPGLIVTYRVTPFPGMRFAWVTEITHVVEGELFVDEQRAGPYRFWHHQHHFRATPGGTEMRDIVHYALPFGPVGDLLGARSVRRRVKGIFEYRRAVLEERFGRFGGADGTRAAGV
jgi:ligand-binding SRPBCC domain-containing protein